MTICKACGGEISVAFLEKHLCPKPNPAYEAERDKYQKVEPDRSDRNERLGIKEIPSSPVWVQLEVFLTGGRVLRYVVPRKNFEFQNSRLIINPVSKEEWSERISSSIIETYRYREFATEAEAHAAAASVDSQ